MQCSKGNNKAIKTSWVDSLIAALRYRLKPDVDDVFMSQTTLFWMLHTTWYNHLEYNRRRELLVVLLERREDICCYSWQPKQGLQLRVHRHTTYSMSTNVAAVCLWTSRSRLDYRPAATRVCLSADRVSAVLALLKQPDNRSIIRKEYPTSNQPWCTGHQRHTATCVNPKYWVHFRRFIRCLKVFFKRE